jgi:hypothetical protein
VSQKTNADLIEGNILQKVAAELFDLLHIKQYWVSEGTLPERIEN